MYTWNVTYHCKPGHRETLYQAICDLGFREHTLKEDGNLKYDYYFSAANPDDLLLIETWRDAASQDAHCSTEIFQKLLALKALRSSPAVPAHKEEA